MNFRQIQAISTNLAFQFLVVALVCANPNHQVLDAPLASHGKETSAAWYKEASKLYESARNNLTEFLEKEQTNGLKNIKADDLGKTHLQLTMMSRGGKWLQIWGEPAGADFELRAQMMRNHLSRMIEASKAFPATQKYMQNFREYVAKTSPARAKALGNIQKLCNENKWPAAEQLLFKVYDTYEPGTVFLSPVENEAIYKPFWQVDSVISTAMQELRAVAANQELTKSIRELTPDFPALQKEIQAAIDSVAATGSATWRNESIAGPALVEKITHTWRETQAQAHQCRGKTWALGFRIANQSSSMAMDPMNTDSTDKITAAYTAFCTDLMAGLVRLVDVDATRVQPEAARDLYVAYLRSFAPVVRQIQRADWDGQLEIALAKLAAKNPELAEEVKNYRAATEDLLRWRARAAVAQAAGKLSEYAPIEERFRTGTTSGQINGVPYTGLFSEQHAGEQQAQLLTNAPDIMPVAKDRLMNQKVTVRDVVRIAPDSKSAIARYSQRTYANLPAPFDLSADIASLKLDLLVSEQAPPLTLATMTAVVTAERGDLRSVGGAISGMHLEGVVTRFATLPASAAVLTPLGQLPTEKFDGGYLRNMLMRFELTPQWACHDYFFVNLIPPANLTASLDAQW